MRALRPRHRQAPMPVWQWGLPQEVDARPVLRTRDGLTTTDNEGKPAVAKKKPSKSERVKTVLNEASGFPAVPKRSKADIDKLAAEAAKDIEQRQDTYEGKHRRADGMPFLYAALLRGVTAA